MKLHLNRFTELQLRILVSLVSIPILLGCILWQPWAYFTIFFIICASCMIEFYKQLLGSKGVFFLKIFGTSNGLLIYTITYLILSKKIHNELYFLLFLIFPIVFLFALYKKDGYPFTQIAIMLLGIIYISVPFTLLHFLAFHNESYHYEMIVSLLGILWANDTGAFFMGRYIGGKKLFERISPKKTWEGSIGGAICALLVSLLLNHYFNYMPLWKELLIAIIVIVSGAYGDLIESSFKRSVQIKDFGSSIPGHGGFLDRFDSLLIASPFLTAFIKLV